MEAIEKRVVLKSEEAVERSAILKAVQENDAADVVEDEPEDLLRVAACEVGPCC
jgi:hypothetical protein